MVGREPSGAPRLWAAPRNPLPISGLGTGEGKPVWGLTALACITQGLSHQSLGRQGAPAPFPLPPEDGAV